ncbi:DNA gyrase subunit A [bacterium HR39]|nr:DNA gyrase subunit A [bacterium HR39]
MKHLPGPDFPTGGIVVGASGIREAYATGRGSITVRGRVHIEEYRKERFAIVVTEIPYLVNKARLVERIAELVRERKLEGVADLRDESDRSGVRVVIELRRDVDPEVILNRLYRFTPLQTTFGVNMVALVGGRPELLDLRGVLQAFLAFREEVVRRRTAFELAKARERANVLAGLAVAVANIDAVIRIIRESPDPSTARERLCARDWPATEIVDLLRLVEPGFGEGRKRPTCRLDERQAQAILDLRLQRLTALERGKIHAELEELGRKIAEYLAILRSREKLLEVVERELLAVREKFADPRRTRIDLEASTETSEEDLIQREDVVVTVTHRGYIKRVPLDTYRAQRRGGRGRSAVSTREDDFVTRLFVANTHTPVLFFTSAGRVYKLKVHELPEGRPGTRGRPLVNLLPALSPGETVSAILVLPEDEERWGELDAVFATARGRVRRNDLSDFVHVPSTGKIAMGLEPGDRLVGVAVCDEGQDVLLASRHGLAIRFPVASLRVFRSRGAGGVTGMDLQEGDEVVSLSILRHVEATPEEREEYIRIQNAKRRAAGENGEGVEVPPMRVLTPERFAELERLEEFVLTVTEKGYGKRTSSYEYRITNRGGQGVVNVDVTGRNGFVAAVFPVAEADHVMLVTDRGRTIRIAAGEIRIVGRRTQGVRLVALDEGERVVSAARLEESENGED